MSGAKKDFMMPVVVLTVICLVISAALAFTNNLTKPIIDAGASERADAVRLAVMPQADTFEKLDASGLPSSVTEAYQAKNGAGYVFTLVAKGYGGDMTILCGIDADGLITACKTLSHSETAGLGSKTAEDEYRNQYAGKDSGLAGVSAISGATISSKAYESAIKDAFAAFESIRGTAQ
ncbi:MAG: FMN-binding protein [Bacillota bacterium]